MKSPAAKWQTADLFAAAQAAAPVPAPIPAPPLIAPPPPIAVPPPPVAPGLSAAPRLKQLWYAVVFPDLGDPDSPDALQKLCPHAQAFTPFVSIEAPNALLLEIKGSIKLFGSLQILQTAIDACWQQLGLKSQSATTPSTLAALWLARAGAGVHGDDVGKLPGLLSKVPIACTAWDAERLQTLRALGLRHVGELLRLPRGGLARRLSPAVVRDIDIAVGKQPAPRRPFVPRERFRERCDFETEIEHVAYLEQALEPLIDRCAQFLRHRQAGVQTLQLRLRHRELPATRVRLGLASITSERRRLADVLCQKLTRLELKAPVRGMELISGSLRALSASSLDVFAGLTGAGTRDTAPQLVERLRARLGEDSVYGVCLIEEHRPEAAWGRVRALPLNAVPKKQGAAVAIAIAIEPQMPRPVWLLAEPLSIPKPELLQGPERIESGWWDGKGVARDYYIACQVPGARLWVFQDRHTQRWYLHGVFS
jgi:protein ImuB